MYIELKADGLEGPARIGRITYSKSGKSLYYSGKHFHTHQGFKSNYFDAESHEDYWISGCRKDGNDSLYGGTVEIDEDVRREYWTKIRAQPECVDQANYVSLGKYRR